MPFLSALNGVAVLVRVAAPAVMTVAITRAKRVKCLFISVIYRFKGMFIVGGKDM